MKFDLKDFQKSFNTPLSPSVAMVRRQRYIAVADAPIVMIGMEKRMKQKLMSIRLPSLSKKRIRGPSKEKNPIVCLSKKIVW